MEVLHRDAPQGPGTRARSTRHRGVFQRRFTPGVLSQGSVLEKWSGEFVSPRQAEGCAVLVSHRTQLRVGHEVSLVLCYPRPSLVCLCGTREDSPEASPVAVLPARPGRRGASGWEICGRGSEILSEPFIHFVKRNTLHRKMF